MNILPHKSWHVWTKKNRERVSRDETKHTEEEEHRKRRAMEVEQEKRVCEMRRRAKRRRGGAGGGDGDHKEESPPPLRHVNLFAPEEEGARPSSSGAGRPKNPDEEKETKEVQLAWEKKVGIVSYLGQSSAELASVKPWYYGGTATAPTDEQLRKDVVRKNKEDPLQQISVFVDRKRQSDTIRTREEHKAGGGQARDTHQRSQDRLRRERLDREAKERERVAALLRRSQRQQVDDDPSEDIRAASSHRPIYSSESGFRTTSYLQRQRTQRRR